jgi:putative membrane protein insertion efficiency factor
MRGILAVAVMMLAPLARVSAEEPWSVDARHPVVEAPAKRTLPARAPSLPARLLDGAVRGYQRKISPHDGPRCLLYPTCSAYARQALQKHGALMGSVMTMDRLVQELEVLRRAPRIRVHGHTRGYDPVEAHDFWWATARPRQPLPPSEGRRERLPGFRRGSRLAPYEARWLERLSRRGFPR